MPKKIPKLVIAPKIASIEFPDIIELPKLSKDTIAAIINRYLRNWPSFFARYKIATYS